MKKNIGAVLALYPTPTVIVGALVDGRPNWFLAGHVGLIGHDRITVSLAQGHYTNRGIKKTGALSVSLVHEGLLEQADYIGTKSGIETDKSSIFDFEFGRTGAPLLKTALLTMDCTVADIYETHGFETFILKITDTYVDESCLNSEGKVDYQKLRPVLFEMPTYEYVQTGPVIGSCGQLQKGKHDGKNQTR